MLRQQIPFHTVIERFAANYTLQTREEEQKAAAANAGCGDDLPETPQPQTIQTHERSQALKDASKQLAAGRRSSPYGASTNTDPIDRTPTPAASAKKARPTPPPFPSEESFHWHLRDNPNAFDKILDETFASSNRATAKPWSHSNTAVYYSVFKAVACIVFDVARDKFAYILQWRASLLKKNWPALNGKESKNALIDANLETCPDGRALFDGVLKKLRNKDQRQNLLLAHPSLGPLLDKEKHLGNQKSSQQPYFLYSIFPGPVVLILL